MRNISSKTFSPLKFNMLERVGLVGGAGTELREQCHVGALKIVYKSFNIAVVVIRYRLGLSGELAMLVEELFFARRCEAPFSGARHRAAGRRTSMIPTGVVLGFAYSINPCSTLQAPSTRVSREKEVFRPARAKRTP